MGEDQRQQRQRYVGNACCATHPSDELVRCEVDARDGVAEHVARAAVCVLKEHPEAATPLLSGQRIRLAGPRFALQADLHRVVRFGEQFDVRGGGSLELTLCCLARRTLSRLTFHRELAWRPSVISGDARWHPAPQAWQSKLKTETASTSARCVPPPHRSARAPTQMWTRVTRELSHGLCDAMHARGGGA